VQRKGYFMHFDKTKWVVDFGALHGAPSDPEKSTGFAIFPENDRAKSIGTASTTLVGPQQSEVKLDFQASARESYWAEITSLPVPPIPVFLEGEEKGTKILQETLDANIGIVLLTDKEDAGAAQYTLVAEKQLLKFINRETGALIQGIDGYSVPNAKRLYGVIKQVVQWERGLALQNKNTKLQQSEVDYQFFELLDDGTEHPYPGDQVTLDFVKSGDTWKKIRFKLKARNQTGEQLWFTLAYFSRKYGISILKNDPVPPAKSGEFVTLFGESPKHALGLRDDVDESIDTFKLIVSRKQVDDFLLMQKDIDLGKIMPSTRDLFGDDDEEEERGKYEDDWLTKTIQVRTVRQLDVVGKRDTALADGKIKIKAHPSVKAKLSLATAKTGTRAAGAGGDIYKVLERQGMQLASLSAGTRAAGDEPGILELTDIENDAALKDNPLEIELDIPLEENENILPIVFDGEHFVLGGDAYKDDAGNTHVSIDRIPDSTEQENRRSLGKALKLYFFKTYLKQENVNMLRWVEYKNDGTIELHKSGVKEQVSKAKKLLLLIHGIIGDTKPIAEGVKMAGERNGKSLAEKYDLVLTYDYENLSTPIEETAAKLKEQLAQVGLKEGDKKELAILAHSMGGLVSRWFIEQEGGDKVVDHLVMCGTPNNGSPFGKVAMARKIMGALTTVALNLFPAFAPVGGVILSALNRSKKITPTLEQMSESSDFMKKLNGSDDPGVRYSILAGDVHNYKDTADKIMPRLIEKTGKSFLLEAVYGNSPHDIAVNLESIKSVDGSRKPAPLKQDVGCHHLNYFSSDAGLAALAGVKW
jgi:pimeloyl-ACP methyl ester carboxylesterase